MTYAERKAQAEAALNEQISHTQSALETASGRLGRLEQKAEDGDGTAALQLDGQKRIVSDLKMQLEALKDRKTRVHRELSPEYDEGLRRTHRM